MDAALDRILDPGYLDAVADLGVDRVRSLRGECQHVETQLSYLRRLLQGHLDIVTGEVARRAEGGAPSDLAGLVERLPEILGDRLLGPGAGRLPTSMAPGELSGRLVDRLDAITGRVRLEEIETASDDDLAQLAGELEELEHEVSSLRRALFDRIDTLQAELTRRYKAGEARVDDLLAGDGS